jgi:hypothetical protein
MIKEGKKAQVSTTTIIFLIIGVFVLAMVILGFTQGWNVIFDKVGLLPDQLEGSAQTCKIYSESEQLKLSYCTFKEIRVDGKKQWLNCDGVYEKASQILASPGFEKRTGLCATGSEKRFCEDNKLDLDDLINAKNCSSWGFVKP